MATAEPRTAPPAEANGQPAHDDATAVRKLADARERIKLEVGRVIVGQTDIIDLLLTALLCRGHVLLHGVPGLGKTLMAKTLADSLAMEFRRVQFTPDLMPSDITGTDIIKEDPASGKHSLEFLPGPVFTNFLLADEINRTPPKTQAALLQAMQETEVTVGRQTFPLPRPFFVVATQNPIEMEGTYPLPEAQVDRFMFSLRIAYPTVDEEVKIIKGTTGTALAKAAAALGIEEVARLQEYVRGVPIADSVVNYAARLIAATRPGCGGPADIHKYLSYGASPRASQCLVLGAKARALLSGRFHVDFADLKALAAPVLRHRLVLNFHARADKIDADALVTKLLAAVPQNA
ncbi:atpase aaa : ATPase associated with various cellular activities, AAA-3 OS=Planctomyces maris DSM 8797 GN=PM8797T_07799 PE=4 SV=1: AAA_3 [Gemmata massiliana]|uniref:AAA+ ATPase domain-containing protein n=1 Tax=Gemmata massiliana TaxID=1210884 RepID=A0A6P2D7Q6_9BACT|nr:MoxR family ATPase [Gemmata massiliana]VTR96164.1 atpase aaa : ATPase associated with various cellular activities, AAA-3 OS=Planctomyces maris DSM 8797 GN=PM8797T_07799 PE=4 SV=1: AAA_3 [Gemmata massiliana]